MAKYIKFGEVLPHPKGVWTIENKRSLDILGRIEWYAPWRQYVAIFDDGAVWSQDCLMDVREFILSLPNAGGEGRELRASPPPRGSGVNL